MNIIKIINGFEMNGMPYLFESIDGKEYEIISEDQMHSFTNNGVILLDLSVKIDNKTFTDINLFTEYLYGKAN